MNIKTFELLEQAKQAAFEYNIVLKKKQPRIIINESIR